MLETVSAVFLAKFKSGFPNPKKDFAFIIIIIISIFWGGGRGGGQIQKRIINPQNPHSGWILRIKPKSGFLRFPIRAFFVGGKGFENSIFDKRFSEQKWYTTDAVTCMTF